MNDDDVRRSIHRALGDEPHSPELVDRVRAAVSLGRAWGRSSMWLVGAATIAVLTLVVGGTTLALRNHRSPSPPDHRLLAVVSLSAPATASAVPPPASASASPSASVGGTVTTSQPLHTGTGTTTQAPSPPPTQVVAPTQVAAPTPSQPPPGTCAAGDLSLTTTTDQATYAAGTSVQITTTMRNVSNRPCTANASGCSPSVHVNDSSGNYVWSSTPPGAGMCARMPPVTLLPGDSKSFQATWGQCTYHGSMTCSGQVPSGVYTATGEWPEGTASSARFTIK